VVKRRQRVHKRLFFLAEEWPWWLEDPWRKMCCVFLGHEPIPDQCGKPEHDFCAWCMKSLPGRASGK
jgi:hypothetical protein